MFKQPKEKRFSWGKVAAFVTRNAKVVLPVLILLLPCLALIQSRQTFDVLSQMYKSHRLEIYCLTAPLTDIIR